MTTSIQEADSIRPDSLLTPYTRTLAAIDAAHALDPTKVLVNKQTVPYELHYANKCTEYLSQRSPDASEHLRIAIRAQHFRRWEVPRSSYPMTRTGYLTWRIHVKARQADLVKQICDQNGYGVVDCERIASLIRKENLESNHETQVLEDVACLVFLDDQFEEFQKEHDEEKIARILKKTWGKMSDEGRKLALEIHMAERPRELIEKALRG